MKNISNILSYFSLFIFAVLPLVLGLGYALLYSLGLVGVLNTGFTLNHWKQLFSSNEVISSLFYTVYLAVTSLVLCIIVSLRVALRYYKYFQKGFLSYLVYLPLAFPSIVAAFFFFQLLSNAGIIARICYQLGLITGVEQFPNLVNDQWSIGIILAQFFLSFPFFILLYVNLIKTERLEEFKSLSAALGASKLQYDQRIAIPLLLRKSFPNILIYFIFKLGTYEVPLLLGRSSPETVSVLAVRKLQKFNLLEIPQGYAVAIIYTVLILILLILFLKSTKEEEYAS